MARLKDLADTTSDLFNIPVELITIDANFNFRIDRPELIEHIETLKASIRDNGFLRSRALTIRMAKDGLSAVIVDGHNRFRAVRELIAEGVEIKSLPCVPEPKGTSEIDRTVMLFTSNNGLNPSQFEEGVLFKRLISFGLSEQDIASKIGKTRQFVANRLDLIAAPQEIQEMVQTGTLSATEAVIRIRQEGEEEAVETFKKAKEIAASEGKTKITAKTLEIVKGPSKRVLLTTAIEKMIAEWDESELAFDAPEALRNAVQAVRELV